MRSIQPAHGLGVALFLAACGASAGCGSGDGVTGSGDGVDGVVLAVVPDLADAPPDVAFAAVPDLLVTDDGRVIYAAPDEYAYDGTLVADVWIAEVSAEGVDMVRAAVAADAAPQTIDELATLIGQELGVVERYLPDTFRFAAFEVGPAELSDDPDTPLVEWPDTASIPLAAATDCTRLPELEVGEVFVTAAENSGFVDDGIIYGVVAAPDWPGAPCEIPG